MAHFAQLGENGIVLQVIAINNAELRDGQGRESERKGIAFCVDLFGGRWVQTSYNANFRKNFAGIGFTYDQGRDAFIPPQPFPSWSLNESTCQWDAPVPRPEDGKRYIWDEPTTTWVELPALGA
jgi:hypothetical protein